MLFPIPHPIRHAAPVSPGDAQDRVWKSGADDRD